jgi:hypothetical protein
MMPHWRFHYLSKHIGTVEAPDEKSAIAETAKTFSITPARRNGIRVRQIVCKGDG